MLVMLFSASFQLVGNSDMATKFTPVSHQQKEDITEYSEFWGTHHHVWVLAIPVVLAALLVIVALVIL
jgi:hypothetical protein